jgi:uncharacterized protein YcbX
VELDVGIVRSLARYPVKSMGGEALARATLGWRGVDGDRRLAFMREGDDGGFPWLTAGRLPALVAFRPVRDGGGPHPTRVVAPDGRELDLFGEPLRAELAAAHGRDVRVVHLKHGVFDDADVSVIAASTVAEVCRLAGRPADERRFRPNVVVESVTGTPFEENDWVGGVLEFGDGGPAVSVTTRDIRCAMINLDPDTGESDASMLKAVARANDVVAGVYATVVRVGEVTVGDRVRLVRR